MSQKKPTTEAQSDRFLVETILGDRIFGGGTNRWPEKASGRGDTESLERYGGVFTPMHGAGGPGTVFPRK